LSGAYFVACLRAGQIPPPGYAFLNRFLHAHPTEWQEQFAAERSAMENGAALRESITKLGDALDRVEHEGAPLPILQALEEAVTLNLTGLVTLVARDVLARQPELRTHSDLAGGVAFGWASDGETDQLAMLIREEASAVDAAISTNAEAWTARPGESFRCCVQVIDTIGERVASQGPKLIEAMAPWHVDTSMERNARRMILAMDAIRQRQQSP
jgi:hypothetical protein